jgi:hypothetical protein
MYRINILLPYLLLKKAADKDKLKFPNQVSVFFRVVRISGGLSGYRWGLNRKIALMAWETELNKALPAAPK